MTFPILPSLEDVKDKYNSDVARNLFQLYMIIIFQLPVNICHAMLEINELLKK